MAIRRPSINSPTWLFQDFLYFEDDGEAVALPLSEARNVNTTDWMKTQIGVDA